MNITQESTGDLTAIIKLEVVPEDYKNSVDKILKDYQRKANIPGFRPGKVPFGMVKKMYGTAVIADEMNKLISENLSSYISDNKIEILGNPLPNKEKQEIVDFDSQEKFEFFFDIGLKPEFTVELTDKMKFDLHKIKADDKVVDKYIEDIRKRNGISINPEVSEINDIIYGDIAELDENGEIKEGGINRNAPISVEFIKAKAIQKKFVGVKLGDIIVFDPIKAFDNETETSSLLGVEKSVLKELKTDFSFTVTEIKRIQQAEMNDELFAKVYPGQAINSEEELREKIQHDAEANFAVEGEKMFFMDVVKKLIKETNISLPDDFMKRWILESASEEKQITEEQIEAQYDNYAESLKWQLIESQILKDNDINITEEDVKQHIKNLFAMYSGAMDDDGKNEYLDQIVDNYMNNKEEVNKIYDKLYEEKLTGIFKSSFKIKEKSISYEDFIKLATENN
ncbi:MAG: trigger factor [Saprospiraceae bacterium]|nr:trigger factor [Saprospiraceae bacterium]